MSYTSLFPSKLNFEPRRLTVLSSPLPLQVVAPPSEGKEMFAIHFSDAADCSQVERLDKLCNDAPTLLVTLRVDAFVYLLIEFS